MCANGTVGSDRNVPLGEETTAVRVGAPAPNCVGRSLDQFRPYGSELVAALPDPKCTFGVPGRWLRGSRRKREVGVHTYTVRKEYFCVVVFSSFVPVWPSRQEIRRNM